MTTTLSEQIRAIKRASMEFQADYLDYEYIRLCLNDAASTIASLNLIKSLSEEEQLEFLRYIKTLQK